MKKFIKEKFENLSDTTPDFLKHDFVLTNDTGLAGALGTIGYRVVIERKKDENFPSYKIGMDENTDENINNYYLGSLIISAYHLAQNIEILSSIEVTESCSIEVPLRKAPKPTGKQDVKEVQEEEEQNIRYYESEEDQYSDMLRNLDDDDIAEIMNNIPS